jgi:hypothetical protein
VFGTNVVPTKFGTVKLLVWAVVVGVVVLVG